MSTAVYQRERLTRGWIVLCQDSTGAWCLAWDPDGGEPDWPGHTYSPADADLPSDYPSDSADPAALVGWGRKHFGP